MLAGFEHTAAAFGQERPHQYAVLWSSANIGDVVVERLADLLVNNGRVDELVSSNGGPPAGQGIRLTLVGRGRLHRCAFSEAEFTPMEGRMTNTRIGKACAVQSSTKTATVIVRCSILAAATPDQASPNPELADERERPMTNDRAVKIHDLDTEGPELSDETLRATRGGMRDRSCYEMGPCSSLMGGGEDCDVVQVPCTTVA